MKIAGKVCVITGGASGIGRELACRFKKEGAKGIAIADMNEQGLKETAEMMGGLPVVTDVTKEADIQNLIAKAEEAFGDIDIFVSNAGIVRPGDENATDEMWDLNWNIHVKSHIYAARAMVPKMTARGGGYLVNTASAAGLLHQVDSATYGVTKHAAVSFAEWISIRYHHKGIRVSVLAPQAVDTPMIAERKGGVASIDGVATTEHLADCVVETMDKEEFLILPHAEVREYLKRKTSDYDRWLHGMRKYRARFYPDD